MNFGETTSSSQQHHWREVSKLEKTMPTDVQRKARKMKLKSLKTRDDMAAVEEDYHTGVPVSVPFMWESEPGTPKVKSRDKGSLHSPLTPPPSSYFSTPSPKPIRKSSRTNILNSVFRKLSVKPSLPSSPGSSSSSSSSSSNSGRERRTWFEWRVDGEGEEEEIEEEEEETTNIESPVSTLFYGRGGANEGCYPKLVKAFSRDRLFQMKH